MIAPTQLYDTTSSIALAEVRDVQNADPGRELGVEEMAAELAQRGVRCPPGELEAVLEALRLEDGELRP